MAFIGKAVRVDPLACYDLVFQYSFDSIHLPVYGDKNYSTFQSSPSQSRLSLILSASSTAFSLMSVFGQMALTMFGRCNAHCREGGVIVDFHGVLVHVCFTLADICYDGDFCYVISIRVEDRDVDMG